jgi:3-oxoadipate enol-lactonase
MEAVDSQPQHQGGVVAVAFVKSGGRSIYYERHGSGPCIVLLHGAGSNGATWWQQVPALQARYTCFTMDLRCFGRSTAPPAELQLPLMVQDLIAMLDQESVPRAAVIGQSLGGMVGLRAALHHPQRIAAFVGCDTSLAVAHAGQLDILEKRLTAVAAMSIEERSLGKWFLQNKPELAALYAQINHFNPSAYGIPADEWRSAMRGLNRPENLMPMAALKEVACPVFLVVGREDPIVPWGFVNEVAGLIPQAEAAVVDNAAHSAYFEQPEIFNRLLLDFLRRRFASPRA